MFGNNKQLQEQLSEQKKLIQELTSEVKALQTHLRFLMDDTEAIRRDVRELKMFVPEAIEGQQASRHNWKVERM